MKKFLRAILGTALGIGFLWLALRGQDLQEVFDVWARSDGSWLLVGTTIYATSLVVRVARWYCLLVVVVPARPQVVGEVLLVGTAMNNVLPARLGELIRADYGKRRLGATRSALLATIVVERLADLAAIVAALLCGMVVLEPLLHDVGRPWRIINFAAVLGGCLFAVALTAVVLLPRAENISQLLPGFVRRRLDDLISALQSLGEVRTTPFIALTLGVWSLEAAALACILHASRIDFHIFELLLVLGLANLGTLVPTAPAYLGSYQFSLRHRFLRFRLELRPWHCGRDDGAGVSAVTRNYAWHPRPNPPLDASSCGGLEGCDSLQTSPYRRPHYNGRAEAATTAARRPDGDR